MRKILCDVTNCDLIFTPEAYETLCVATHSVVLQELTGEGPSAGSAPLELKFDAAVDDSGETEQLRARLAAQEEELTELRELKAAAADAVKVAQELSEKTGISWEPELSSLLEKAVEARDPLAGVKALIRDAERHSRTKKRKPENKVAKKGKKQA